ncbi:MAG: DUF2958 domain-containing protein [Bacteroides sp.]|nr:DUF2958 domain-containing protein [Bacteroides sp.]
MCRLLTPQFEEAIKDYPLYSQDDKKKDAICVAIFAIGNVRWFILEGSRDEDDTRLFGIVVGLQEDEYGYISLNELSDIELDCRKHGYGILRVVQVPYFKPCPIGKIADKRLQKFLTRLYH